VHRPRGLGRSLLARVSFAERGLAEFALATYHIQHVDAITVVTVEDPAAWLNDLAIAPATQFLWFRATVRVSDQTGRARSSSASEEHTSELQSPCNLVCRLLLEKKKKIQAHQQFTRP